MNSLYFLAETSTVHGARTKGGGGGKEKESMCTACRDSGWRLRHFLPQKAQPQGRHVPRFAFWMEPVALACGEHARHGGHDELPFASPQEDVPSQGERVSCQALFSSAEMGCVKFLQLLACSVLLVCSSSAEEEEEEEEVVAGLTQDQVAHFLKKGIFLIQSEDLNKCIKADTSSMLTLEDCTQFSTNMLWKWGSKQHLFNIGRSTCLGLNISNEEQPLILAECDSVQHLLWWKCHGKMLVGASQYKLAVENDKFIAAKRASDYRWKHFMSYGGDLCEHAFKETYTLLGNSLGLPCVFPFKYNNKWHYECIRDYREDGYPWCATTSQYEQDEKWGLCPNSEAGCDIFWKKNADTQICYQFNLFSVLPWNEAHVACQGQGADLLSITDTTEQKYIGDLSEQLNTNEVLLWTGLNQLDEAGGWQWSDGAPLALINWGSDPTDSSLGQHRCKVFNSKVQHDWQSYSCESGLPYVCKKYLNATEHETFDSWKFYPTNCDYNWYPHNRYCYKLHKEEKNWSEALLSCQDDNSTLISITSLADVEMLINLLEYENVTETWIGLSSNKTPIEFEWSDGSAVTISSWHKQEPNIHQRKSQLCVSAQQHEAHWKVKSCEDKYVYICKRGGNAGNSISEVESGCPEGWERHGGYCYNINKTPRSFEHSSSGYYCPSLATVMSRFEQSFLNSMIHNIGKTDNMYFWIALQDLNNTGEYTWPSEDGDPHLMTYTNWNKYQPRHPGGCVVMRQEKPVGVWEVKNCTGFKAMSLCKQEAKFHEEHEPKSEQSHFEEPSISCMFGWESNPNLLNCYKIFHSEKVLMKRSWDEAEALCQDFGAHLASFTHVSEEDFISKLLNTMFHNVEDRQFWIGLTKRNQLSGGSWEWSDGTPVTFAFLENANVEDDVRNCAAFKVNGTVLLLHCQSEHEWICKIPKGVKPKIPQWYINEPSWFYYQGAEYLFHVSASDWATFQFVCGWLHGDIVTIHSSKEQEFIQNRIKKQSKANNNWWIALHSVSPDEGFRWADDTPLLYQNWEGGAESLIYAQGEKCGFISSETGLWGFADCTISLPCICKRKMIWVIERPIPKENNSQGVCPKGWLYFGFKCFLVQIPKDANHMKNWYSAQTLCNQYGGSLASVENEIEQAFITMNLFGHKSNIWIGLQSNDYEKWVNGQEVEYSNWSPVDVMHNLHNYSAKIQEKAPLCTLILNNPSFNLMGKWYLENCENVYGFVCQKAQDTSRYVIDSSVMYPVPDTLEYADRTYTLISGNMTWYMALKTCKTNGAELVSISDHYHQAFLTVIINRLGYTHWIGLFTSDDGLSFQWSDGTKPFLMFWEDEESQTSGRCVYIDINGRWRRTSCETLLNGAVCHIPPKRKPTEYKGLCNEKTVPWIKFKNSCYSFSTVLENSNFDEAFEFCKKQGSNLLTVKDDNENIFLLEELHSFGSLVEMIWLNIHFLTNNNTIVWFDGSPLNFSNWGIKEPEPGQLKGNVCIALRTTDGIWQLSPCQERKGFVCKTSTDYHEVTIQSVKVSYHQMVVLGIFTMLMIIASACACWWCLHKPSNLFRGILWFRNACPAEVKSEVPAVEETILISDLGRNDDL
ncbi:secretory phospholipase A2 receptor [Hemicordylus capensis]|uniref:secretory phospholipase A2 receptor n=1 Tax=Hemicordylus capensis TaxID=884348 RepID=UPI002303872E|nr:secretory phospholipase A2 receptor [Hemicordylus capensis]